MKLIVGLGNPGSHYSGNRHNIGFICVNHFAGLHSIHWDKKQANARTGAGMVEGKDVLLAKPQTYMNLSGQSVSRLMNKFKVKLDDLIVIHDDLDLSLGRIRIRKGGSSGGHKGINSIIIETGSRDFIRIRFGIGRPKLDDGTVLRDEEDIVDFVLSSFTPDEKEKIQSSIELASEAVACLLNEGLETAMNKYN